LNRKTASEYKEQALHGLWLFCQIGVAWQSPFKKSRLKKYRA